MSEIPFDIEIERAVLGAILVDKTAIDRCHLQPYHFYNKENAAIFEVMRALATKNTPIDLITVSSELKANKEVNYPHLLATMTAKISSSANIEYHSAILSQMYAEREVLYLCQRAINAIASKKDVFDVISNINRRLDEFYIGAKRDFQKFKDVSKKVLKKIEDIQESKLSVVGISTGFRAMNDISHGFHAPDLIILAARTAVGKTAFALNLAYNVAIQNIPILFFSLEMSAEQLSMRMVSIMTSIPASYLTKAQVNEGGWHTLMNTDYNIPFYIDDTPSLDVLEFKEKSRRAKKELGIKMIFVDYLTLMTAHTKGNRQQEVAILSRNLKMIAKEIEVPIIALAQMGRDVEKSHRKPRLSDLFESSTIEADADIVMALHTDTDEPTRMMDIIYLKHRNGPIGTINLMFDTGKQKFYDL